MKILTVIQHFTPTLAGAEKFAQTLAEHFQLLGTTNLVVTGRWERDWPKEETIHGLRVYRHNVFWLGGRQRRMFAGLTSMVFLFFFLLRHHAIYDLILVHQAHKGAFISALAGKILGKPVVVVVHCAGRFGDLHVMRSGEFGFYTKFLISGIRRSSAFVAICTDIERELREEGFDRVSLIFDGIEVKNDQGSRNYSSSSRLITLARLHPQKGIDILLRAVSGLNPSLPWQLDIYGEGPERETLEKLKAELNIQDRVRFHGHVSSVDAALENADIFVLPSRGEGMGLALLEAMNFGLPCIVTRVSGFVDIIENGINGYLVEPENPTALALKLEEVMSDSNTRERIGMAARQTVSQRFSIESSARQYLALFKSLLENH